MTPADALVTVAAAQIAASRGGGCGSLGTFLDVAERARRSGRSRSAGGTVPAHERSVNSPQGIATSAQPARDRGSTVGNAKGERLALPSFRMVRARLLGRNGSMVPCAQCVGGRRIGCDGRWHCSGRSAARARARGGAAGGAARAGRVPDAGARREAAGSASRSGARPKRPGSRWRARRRAAREAQPPIASRDRSAEPSGAGTRVWKVGTPGRTRTCAPGSGGRCSIL
jgi:hypothetical protein